MASRISPVKTGRELLPHCKVWVKPADKMDLWLDSQGYYRKHTARDGSCLFRAVSEQLFLTQAFHLKVRRQCSDFALRHPEHFEKALKCSLKEYVEKIRNPNEWGGKLEIEAMALLYRRDFILYQEIGQPAQNVTNYGFDNSILLCFSQDRHYDTVYTKEHITNAAFCQSIVYDVLYKGVFQLQEVDYAVKKMLHDKTSQYRHQRESSFLASGLALRLEMRDSCVNVKDLLTVGVTPFPYKVAKSLDPDIYRNVEYDTWNDYRRGLRFGINPWNNRELQVGVKCLVNLQPDRVCLAHIQEMEPNKGPVVVFVEELGEKITVSYDSLELLPQPAPPQVLPIPVKQLRLQGLKISSGDDTPSSNSDDIEDDGNDDNQLMVPWSPQEKQWSREDDSGRKTPKVKMFSELQRNHKRSKSRTKSKEGEMNKQAHNQPSSSGVSPDNSMECSYTHEVMEYQDSYENFHCQNYMTQYVDRRLHRRTNRFIQRKWNRTTHHTFNQFSESIWSCETISEHSTDAVTTTEVSHHCTPQTILCLEPTTPYYTHIQSGQTHLGDANNNFQSSSYCTMIAQKSVLPDCSDLPLSDLPTLRYFYNYGVDQYLRVNRIVRPGPPCYLNTGVSYVPEHACTPISPVMTSPDSTLAINPVGFYRPRPESVASNVGGASGSTESEVSHNSHHLAPRFKNKARPSNITAKQGVTYEGPPLVQQCEVSSSTPAPPQTHFLPSPITPYSPPAPPPPPQPIYYVPVECDAYCPANFVEYNMYDTTNSNIYPTVYPQPVHSVISTNAFIPPEAVIYQHVLQPAQIPPNI